MNKKEIQDENEEVRMLILTCFHFAVLSRSTNANFSDFFSNTGAESMSLAKSSAIAVKAIITN